jgi:hypothetical protein
VSRTSSGIEVVSMDETPASSPEGRPDDDGLTGEIPRDEMCVAVEILAELREVPGTRAYQILVEGAERLQLSVRETARLVVMSPSAIDQAGIAS